jgi:hypothetical protein
MNLTASRDEQAEKMKSPQARVSASVQLSSQTESPKTAAKAKPVENLINLVRNFKEL